MKRDRGKGVGKRVVEIGAVCIEKDEVGELENGTLIREACVNW